MVNQSLSTSSTVVRSVEELFDALSAPPPLVHCRKCGSRLLQMNATFFFYGGKVGPPTGLSKLRAHTIQPRARRRTRPATASPTTRMSAGRRKKQVISPCEGEMSERWMLTAKGYAQYVRSKLGCPIASAMCLGSRFAVSSMSATGRATLRMRSWAGAWPLLSHGAFGQALADGGELAESADEAGGRTSIYTRREHPRCDLTSPCWPEICGKLGLCAAEH